MYLETLAVAQMTLYRLTDENEDLEGSISHAVEAILSFDPQIGHDSDVIKFFFFLADSLFHRSQKLKRPGDGKHCLRYFRYLRDQSLETSHVTRGYITTAFTQALANQVQMESIDPMRNIEEMAILCRELLSLDASDELLFSAVEKLVKAIKDVPFLDNRPPPDQAIECLREVNTRFPDLEGVSFRLLFSFVQRFGATHSHADYEDAISIVDGSFTRPEVVKLASSLAVELARGRFYFYGNPEYLEEAIYRIRIYPRMVSSKDPDRQEMTRLLEKLEKSRFDQFSVASNLQAVDAGNTEVNNHPSPPHLVSPLPTTRSDIGELSPMMQDMEDLRVLETLLRRGLDQPLNRAGIEEAIERCRHHLESSQSSGFLTSSTNALLAHLLIQAFHHTGDMAHLNESITLHCDVLKSPVTPFARLNIIQRLISALWSRFLRFREMVDAEEIMQLYPIAAADTCAKIPDRFDISCQWLKFAWDNRHPSTSTAYESVISLMKNTLAFSPTLEIQHHRLVSRRVDY